MPRSSRIHFSDLLRFLRLLLRRFHEDRCLQLAASLTFTTLLSLVPLVTIMLTILSAFPSFGKLTANLDRMIVGSVLPDGVGEVVRAYVEEFSRNAAQLTALGITMLSATALALMLTIERAFNAVWRIRRERPLAKRVMMYWAIITLGPVLIGVSLTMTSYVVSMSLGWTGDSPLLHSAVFQVAPYLFTVAAFALLYWVVPNRPIIFRQALVGAIIAGTLFELIKRAFVLYVTHFPTYAMVYGTFATFPVFLMWVYLSWIITALGAEVAALLPDWRSTWTSNERSRGALFFDALTLLRTLILAQTRSEVRSGRMLADLAGLPFEYCEEILFDLEELGWVARPSATHWALTCDPDVVSLAQVFWATVLDTRDAKRRHELQTNPLIQGVFGEIEGVLAKVSIRNLALEPNAMSGSSSGKFR